MDIQPGKGKGIRLNKLYATLSDNSWIELILRWVLGFTFIYVSYHKIVYPAKFVEIIYGYYLFPDYLINLLAIIVPFLELFSGLALVTGIYPRSAAFITCTMLLAFTIAISINLFRGLEFECGCFSFGESVYSYSVVQVLIKDIVFFIFGIHVLFFKKKRKWCLRQCGSVSTNVTAAS